jgi:hypothetical protein
MFLLDNKKYHIVLKPLLEVGINHLFARTVVENVVTGSIYVDNIEDPKSFHVFHPYGNSLLFGENGNNIFNAWLLEYCINRGRSRDKHEWMQAYPGAWHKTIPELFGDNLVRHEDNSGKNNNKAEVYSRVNFKFNTEKYLDFKRGNSFAGYKLYRTDKSMYDDMHGKVLPKYFWKNGDQFSKEGIGFSLKFEGTIVSTAFSAFIFENQLEIGIETIEEYRGKGFAECTCSALIDYCLENDFEPVWSCRLDNVGSYNLAQKLGFEPTLYIPLYRLVAGL